MEGEWDYMRAAAINPRHTGEWRICEKAAVPVTEINLQCAVIIYKMVSSVSRTCQLFER